MVDVLVDPEMVGFKRERPKYPIHEIYALRARIPKGIMEDSRVIEDYSVPYRSSKAGCL